MAKCKLEENIDRHTLKLYSGAQALWVLGVVEKWLRMKQYEARLSVIERA